MSGHTKTDLRSGRLPVRTPPATTGAEQQILLEAFLGDATPEKTEGNLAKTQEDPDGPATVSAG